MEFSTPNTLPVLAHKDAIIKALQNHQVIIIAGETGSGKTTQLPKFCREALPENSGVIGCTQPRRLAAVSVSARVAEELGDQGNIVGYKIRFRDKTTRDTQIKFMTDGVLLAETRQDPLLKKYSVIIVDEAHERSLNIDFLLGFLTKLLPKRPDLKVIITSATIDTEAFSQHFSNAPVIEIEGRSYPVDVIYSSIPDEDGTDKTGYIEHCAQTIGNLIDHYPTGDILAFLPTERDIRTCCEMLTAQQKDSVILPLFGRLQSSDQKKIFQSFSRRKVIVATNVAETSITVPGIRYVVDAGLARMAFYNPRAKTTSLPVHKISRANCDQRKGRCGRVGPGVCIRLYSEDDYLNRDEYMLPEIMRSNLSEAILQMISLNLGHPQRFPFIDAPHSSALRDGFKLLTELGAIDRNKKLTSYGRLMAQLPMDPCISRIIIEARNNNCLKEIKIIATALAIQDPRVRPADREKEADQAHALFAHPHSDFLALLNIWHLFHNVQGSVKSWSRLKKFCKAHFLSFQRMREWLDLHEQMSRILERRKNFVDNTEEASYAAIHQAIAVGFLRNIALRTKDKIYQGANNREVMVFPGSHQFSKSGNWIIAASFLETNRLYALTVATIEPEWLEKLAKNLCTYSWSSPRYHKKSGQVICDEKVTLFGLPIVASRRANFAKTNTQNQQEAREIFIMSALVEGRLSGDYSFLKNNQKLCLELQAKEDMFRKKDILADDLTLCDLYNQRLPDNVCDRASLNRYLKRTQKSHQRLCFSQDDIINHYPEIDEKYYFPDHYTIGSYSFPLSYSFAPGDKADGVTITLPASLAQSLNSSHFDWQVPGLLKEKATFLLKGLPKKLRKQLVPLNTTIDALLDDITLYEGSFYRALEKSIQKMHGVTIRRQDWPIDLPAHLIMNIDLIDTDGTTVDSGRDLRQLSTRSATTETSHETTGFDDQVQHIIDLWSGKTCTTWDFDTLPSEIPLRTQDNHIAGYLYPALIFLPEKGCVSLEFSQDSQTAMVHNREGVTGLYRLQFSEPVKQLKRYIATSFSGPSTVWLKEGLDNSRQMKTSILTIILQTLFASSEGEIPTKETFDATVARVRQQGAYKRGKDMCDTILAALRQRREVYDSIQQSRRKSQQARSYVAERYEDYHQSLMEILPPDFLTSMQFADIEATIRYFRSLVVRIERAEANPAKDDTKAAQLQPHQERYATIRARHDELTDECRQLVREFNTMIQEFRISLFSPEIKTQFKISAKKLTRHWQKIDQTC